MDWFHVGDFGPAGLGVFSQPLEEGYHVVAGRCCHEPPVPVSCGVGFVGLDEVGVVGAVVVVVVVVVVGRGGLGGLGGGGVHDVFLLSLDGR